MSVTESAYNAAIAYRQAVEDAGNFIDQQMRQYGWTAPGADGQYSVLNAQNAFDPDRVIQFDQSGAPMVDTASIAAATRGGQYGTSGLFAQTAQQLVGQAAEARLEESQRGFGRGSGLTQQRKMAAETFAQERMGALSNQFLQNVLGRYQGLTKQFQNVSAGAAQGAAASAARRAGMTSFYNI